MMIKYQADDLSNKADDRGMVSATIWRAGLSWPFSHSPETLTSVEQFRAWEKDEGYGNDIDFYCGTAIGTIGILPRQVANAFYGTS